jgi:hypothetical protein
LKVRYRIFVPVVADSTSLREVEATPAGDGQFRIVGVMPRNEPLQFRRGEVVECEIRKLPGGSQGLVAIRSVSADPEFRKRRNMFAVLGGLVGGILGLAIALWIETSATSAALGFGSGALIFGFSSVRWGDSAWMILSHILDCG